MTLTPEKLAELRKKAQDIRGHKWKSERNACVFREEYDINNDDHWEIGAVASCHSYDVCDFIAAADPQTVLALVEEVERLRAKNAAYHDRLHHPCEGCPGCSSNDCPDALDIAQIDLAEVRDEILRLRDSNAKVTDARDNLLDEVGRLRSMEATLQAIVRDMNEARGDGGSKLGIGGAYGAVVSLIGENARWMEECYHQQSKAERLQARVAELEARAPEREVGS